MSEAGVRTVEELEHELKALVEQNYLESWEIDIEEGIVWVTFSRSICGIIQGDSVQKRRKRCPR